MNLVRQLLWRAYQIALFFFGLFLFWTLVGQKDVWFWQIIASFVFAFFVGMYGTILTTSAIDRFRAMRRNKSLDNFP